MSDVLQRAPNVARHIIFAGGVDTILTCRRHPPPHPLSASQRPADRDSRSITSAFHVQLSRRCGGLADSAAAPHPVSPPRRRPFGSTAASTTSRGRTADDARPRVIIFRHFALIAPPTTTHPPTLPLPDASIPPPRARYECCVQDVYAARNIIVYLYHNAGAQNIPLAKFYFSVFKLLYITITIQLTLVVVVTAVFNVVLFIYYNFFFRAKRPRLPPPIY